MRMNMRYVMAMNQQRYTFSYRYVVKQLGPRDIQMLAGALGVCDATIRKVIRNPDDIWHVRNPERIQRGICAYWHAKRYGQGTVMLKGWPDDWETSATMAVIEDDPWEKPIADYLEARTVEAKNSGTELMVTPGEIMEHLKSLYKKVGPIVAPPAPDTTPGPAERRRKGSAV